MSSTSVAEPWLVESFDVGHGPAVATRRILHLINGQHYSGAERVQDLLALRLPDYHFDVGFACLRPERFAGLRTSQTPLHELPMRGKVDLRPAWELANIIRRDDYCLIHTHTPRAALIGHIAARLANVPMVHHVHSPTTADSTRGWVDRFNAMIERRSLRRVAAVIAVSTSMGLYANRQGIPPHRIFVVPNGVPCQESLVERSLPTGVWTLGTVALFRPRKGLEVLLRSLAELRSQGLRVRLRAVGTFETPEYETEIKRLAGELSLNDTIDWVGFTRDVTSELARMDLFVLPSLFGEGLPMVVLEAMAAGVPIVATRVEGTPEAVRHGIDGLLTVPGNPLDLAHSIGQVINGAADWHGLRESAYRRHAERFSDDSLARGVAEVYRHVLDS